MAYRETLSKSDWETLQFGVIAAFFGVAHADGKVDEKEIHAFAREMLEAPLYKSALAKEIFPTVAAELTTLLPRYGADKRNLLAHITDVADVLDRVAPDPERQAFKGALMTVAVKVAQASGGVLGFGDKVSKDEKVAVATLGVALRLAV